MADQGLGKVRRVRGGVRWRSLCAAAGMKSEDGPTVKSYHDCGK